ncbi:MAG: FtsX-like permease family protein [Solirubrobacteraceae bacterium]
MGRLLLISRLVAGDIRRRPVQSALLVVMVLTTTTALTLGLALHGESTSPFARTRAATRGPDVVAETGFAPGSNRPSTRQFASLLHAPGIAATGGPYPVAFGRLIASRIDVPVQAVGRDTAPAAIDRPLVVAGSWVRSGGAVIERGFADALGLKVGDAIRVDGHPFRVAGIALSTQQPFYPACTPGLIWLTRSDARALAAPSRPLGYLLEIKLTDPAAAATFWNSPAVNAFANATQNEPSVIEPWQEVRRDDYRVISLDQKVLLIGAWLLSMLAIASIAVVVGARMAEQTRRVGLLKAVGGTPGLVALVLLAENLLLALVAAVAGLVAGELLAPLLTTPGRGLLGSEGTPQLTVGAAAIVVGVAIAVAVLATLAPAIRGARTSTIRALNDPARPPKRRPWVIALSARLPVPMLFALRLVARRTRRTLLTCAGLMVAVTMVVAALIVQHDLVVKNQQTPPAGFFVSSEIGTGANHVLVVLSVILVLLAAISATFTAWATAIDAQGSTALARALGATPRQISAGLTTAQLLPGFVAACLGIPAGVLLFRLAGGDLTEAQPPVLWLLAVIPGTLIAVTLVTAIPARIGARRPVAEVLRAD